MDYFFINSKLRLGSSNNGRLVMIEDCSLGLGPKITRNVVGNLKEKWDCHPIQFFGNRVLGKTAPTISGLVVFENRELRSILKVTNNEWEANEFVRNNDCEIVAVDVLGHRYIASNERYFF